MTTPDGTPTTTLGRVFGLVVTGTVVVTLVLLGVAWYSVVSLDRITALAEDNHRLASVIKDQADKGEMQRRLLVECLTPPPPPGQELDEQDKVHECLNASEASRTRAVDRIDAFTLAALQCVMDKDPQLEACINTRLGLAPVAPPLEAPAPSPAAPPTTAEKPD